MNKKILIGIILVVIVIVLFMVVKNRNLNKNTSKQLELTYKSNGGVPFKWEYEIQDKDIVEFVKSYVVEDKNKGGMVGAPIKTKYVFKGLKEGHTVIIFRYVSITNGDIDKEVKNVVNVDKNNNISLVLDEED